MIEVRKLDQDMIYALVQEFDVLKRDVALAGAKPHADITSTQVASDRRAPSSTPYLVTAANASDLATSLALLTNVEAVLARHYANAKGHKVADGVNSVISAAAAIDLATAITRANEVKADYNLHVASTTYHYVADATNTIAAANATDQASLNTLLNELKTDVNAHNIFAIAAKSISLVGP